MASVLTRPCKLAAKSAAADDDLVGCDVPAERLQPPSSNATVQAMASSAGINLDL